MSTRHTDDTRDHLREIALRDLEAMRTTGELTPAAADDIRARMDRGEDAYVYFSVVHRPFVWALGRRWTPDKYSAFVAGDRSALRNPDGGPGSPPPAA